MKAISAKRGGGSMNEELVCDLLTEAWDNNRVYAASYGGDVLLTNGHVAIQVPATHPWLDSRRRCPTIPTDVTDGTICYSANDQGWPKGDLGTRWQQWNSDQQAEPLEMTQWQYEHLLNRYRLLRGQRNWYINTTFTDLLGLGIDVLVEDYQWSLSNEVEQVAAVLARHQSSGQLVAAIGIARIAPTGLPG